MQTPAPVEYAKATSVADAIALLEKYGEDARIIAGGHSLIPMMRLRIARPEALIDINDVAELKGISIEGNEIVIGAMVRHAEVLSSPVLFEHYAIFREAEKLIADPVVRNRGTIGGSVANNDPAADYPAAVLALDAAVVTNKREIAAGDYFQGMFATALEEGEIIVSIKFNIPKRAAYEKFPHPASGYAMAGVFVAEGAKGLRVAVTGAASGVFRWEAAEKALAKKMSVDALEGVELATDDMNEDIHATREYRANLARVMTKRALQKLLAA